MTSIWDDAIDRIPESEVGTAEAPLFPPALTQDLFGLLHLGKLESTVEIGVHIIKIRTLTVGEELQVANLIKEHTANPLSGGRAYATAVSAAAIENVDGKPLALALAPNEDLLPQKFNVVRKWYWPVVEKVYEEYLSLEAKQEEVFKELEKKVERSLSDLSNISDSSNVNSSSEATLIESNS